MKFLLPGSLALAMFVSVMIGGGMLYIDDKARGVHEGYLVTPITKLELVLGLNMAGSSPFNMTCSSCLHSVSAHCSLPPRFSNARCRRLRIHEGKSDPGTTKLIPDPSSPFIVFQSFRPPMHDVRNAKKRSIPCGRMDRFGATRPAPSSRSCNRLSRIARAKRPFRHGKFTKVTPAFPGPTQNLNPRSSLAVR